MQLLRISKTQFYKALNILNKDYEILIPRELDNKIKFIIYSENEEINFDLKKPEHSIKEFLLPHSENLFYYNKNIHGKENLENSKKILIGVKPCDAKTFKLLDFNFLTEKPIDPYYKSRRENTLIISSACKRFDENCFCDSLGDSPMMLNSADAMIYDLDDHFNILISNDTLLKYFENYIDESKEVKDDKDNFEKGPVLERKSNMLPIDKIKNNLKSLIQNNVLCKKIESTCIGCGTCTFICPACYCFDINDESWGSSGKRVRTYDSCMYAHYTLEASGHNPRKSGIERWRQRLLHKFNYYPSLYNEFGCSGCGRCIDKCPTKIDIREVITDAAK